ncbi:hypothetical protein CAAN1_14S04170 [[Candida] anglica]|uniref:K Homology domain-containing protein n=1 Tax=[Candida] anglica TaxID=148631 RepID=A0ABP0EIF5_9ASCO
MSSTNTGSNLKRKNEDEDSLSTDQLNKRVALDSEQLAQAEKEEDDAHTAPAIGNDVEVPAVEESTSREEVESDQSVPEVAQEQSKVEAGDDGEDDDDSEYDAATALDGFVGRTTEGAGPSENTGAVDSEVNSATAPAAVDTAAAATGSIGESDSKPVSNHREKEGDPTYVNFRMYCPVKEASSVVGKKGEKINHIRDKANVRINVSENLPKVPERIVSVRGPAENVARAFGLIVRTILEEPEDEPASMLSKPYELKILVPHPLVGYIIGKQGSKFREIEENSAAKLKAAEQPLPYSTDRILSITGVGDAIHIAIYYISQVIIEHKDCLKKKKVIFYNPANFHHMQPAPTHLQHSQQHLGAPTQQQHHIGGPPPHLAQNPHTHPTNNHMMMPQGQNMMIGGGGMQDMNNSQNPYQQQQKPYNFQMMFQPAVHPQQYGAPVPNPAVAMAAPVPQQQYTDEHGNTIVGDVITNAPVPAGTMPDKYNQDIFVANENIGSVIGKGGNNIKQIRLNSGCTYVKIEPDQHQSIMLAGKGMTNIRKLTLTGSLQAIQMAIYLINQRIAVDKERNSH